MGQVFIEDLDILKCPNRRQCVPSCVLCV